MEKHRISLTTFLATSLYRHFECSVRRQKAYPFSGSVLFPIKWLHAARQKGKAPSSLIVDPHKSNEKSNVGHWPPRNNERVNISRSLLINPLASRPGTYFLLQHRPVSEYDSSFMRDLCFCYVSRDFWIRIRILQFWSLWGFWKLQKYFNILCKEEKNIWWLFTISSEFVWVFWVFWQISKKRNCGRKFCTIFNK